MLKRILFVSVALSAITLGSVDPGAAHADPARQCTAVRPCLTPQYCPDTGQFVVGYQQCDSLTTGPYSPGGLEPNE